MTHRPLLIHRLAWPAALLFVTLACSQADVFSPPATQLPPISNPTLVPSCAPVTKPEDEAVILYNAQVAEHAQAKISILILTPKLSQRVEFIKPDRYLWHSESGGVWDEAMSIGGATYARSSAAPAWAPVTILDPMAAIMMQTFIDPPKKTSSADTAAQLAKAGIDKVNARLIGYDAAAFFGSCVYDLTFLSGATIVYSQKTWIDPHTGARFKFEAKDETGAVIESRLFEYEDVKIEAP